MNLLQEIFLVSFSILYGTMLNACLGLGLFHFAPERVHKIVRMRLSAKGTSMGVLLYVLLFSIGFSFLLATYS